jgi:hypothetical protein
LNFGIMISLGEQLKNERSAAHRQAYQPEMHSAQSLIEVCVR